MAAESALPKNEQGIEAVRAASTLEPVPPAGSEPGEAGFASSDAGDRADDGALEQMASIDAIVDWLSDQVDAERQFKPVHKYQQLAQAK